MTTFFSPKTFATVDALKAASCFNAISDQMIGSEDVFGYVDGVPYAAVYSEDDDDGVVWVSAGEPIE